MTARRDGTMSNRPRPVKVLAALLVAMTAAAVVLMALGNNPPSAGPFQLSSYYNLDPVQEAIFSKAAQSPGRWKHIEIYYSGTRAGNIEQLAALSGLAGPEDINCHFCLCNGLGGCDGQIQTTERWQRQWSVVPAGTWYGSGQTIRICVIANAQTTPPTDFQVKRTDALVEALCRKFDIKPQSIYYPGDWQ